jgi:hypothetical protein
VLVAFVQAIRGRVQCLVVSGDRVYCGGGGGATLKVLDGRTLSVIQQYNLIAHTGAVDSSSNVAAGGKARPRSASAAGPRGRQSPRPSTANSHGSRAAAALSTHKKTAAAAGSETRRVDDSNIISGPAAKDEVAQADNAVDSGSGAQCVTGLAVVHGSGRGSGGSTYILAALGTGKMVRVDCGAGVQKVPSSDMGRDILYFHTGAVYGLAADVTKDRRLVATVGDDRKLMVWDAEDCVLIAKTLTEVNIMMGSVRMSPLASILTFIIK